jgi:hypothetical protein
MKNKILLNNNIFNKRKISLDKISLVNSYENVKNDILFKKINHKNNNNIIFNKTPKAFSKLYKSNICLKKHPNNNFFRTIDHSEKDKNKTMKEAENIKLKIYNNVLSKSKTYFNFFKNNNNDLEILNNSNNIIDTKKSSFLDIKLKKKTKNKLNQTRSSLLSTKLSQNNNTIYFNSSLDNFYENIVKKKPKNLNIISPLNKFTQTNLKTKNSFFQPKSNNIDIVFDIINSCKEEIKEKNNDNNNQEKVIINNNKYNSKINKRNKGMKINEKNNKSNEDYLLSGFSTYNQIILKNLFRKNSAKIKNDILDRVLLDYNLESDDIFLKPFSNSYGIVLDNVVEKVGFMKGYLDFVYPKIIQKKYQIKAKESIEKIGLLKSSSQENLKISRNDIRKHIFTIKQRNETQSLATKYPIHIRLKEKNMFSPQMYTNKGKIIFCQLDA